MNRIWSAASLAMALPEELLDELLSAHLDDALSGDERRRVEQMLRDDPSVNARFEQLRKQKQDLFRAAVAVPKLPDGFAEQVVQAAIERAEAESLDENHPLRRAGRVAVPVSAAGEGSAGHGKWTPSRAVAAVVALAASIGFVAFMLNNQPDKNTIGPDQPVAGVDPEVGVDRVLVPIDDVAEGASDDRTLLVERETQAGEDGMTSDVSTVEAVAVEKNGSREALNQRGQIGPADNLTQPDSDASPAMVAEADPKQGGSEELAPSIAPLNMLLVVDIKRSEAGRLTGVFDQALVQANIEVGDERQIDENLAKAVDGSESSQAFGGQVTQVVLLESPAKKLDLLVNQLASDRQGIEAMGFSVISAQFDAPLLRSIESVRTVDPTKIRHQGQSIPIVSQSGDVFQKWSGHLVNREFAPLRSEEDAEMIRMMAAADNGPDQMASILFLVR